MDTSKDLTLRASYQDVPRSLKISYASLLQEATDLSSKDIVAALEERLPYVWRDAYLLMSPGVTNIVRFRLGAFEYIFDDYATLETAGAVPDEPTREARLVAVSGRSCPRKRTRDDYRLKGWVGPTQKAFGRGWDKGHFIAHSIGGAVDRAEVNVFIQRRDLNRGWSAAGRRFREMEKYCAAHPGTFCFSRPIYLDQTATPSFVEFGVLMNGRNLCIECFDNR